MKESEIQDFWNKYPCGDFQVGGLQQHKGDYELFFSKFDHFRYHQHKHLLSCLDNIEFQDKHVLEIGLGQGADSEQIINRGAIWSGLDLTHESIARVQTRLNLRQLPHHSLKQGSVLEIPYENNSFDIVFSHGVLHHVPNISLAQKEIHRVLKANGKLIIMVYARWSLNYLLSINILRRLGLISLYLLNSDVDGLVGQHLTNARSIGLLRYLKMKNFIHKNTDGPLNPYSKVYDLSLLKKDFTNFEVTRTYKRYMHAPPLNFIRLLPLESILGWHLWVHLRPT